MKAKTALVIAGALLAIIIAWALSTSTAGAQAPVCRCERDDGKVVNCPTPTPTPTGTAKPSASPSPTASVPPPSPTATATASAVPSATPTQTASVVPSGTPTPEETATGTPVIPSATPTVTTATPEWPTPTWAPTPTQPSRRPLACITCETSGYQARCKANSEGTWMSVEWFIEDTLQKVVFEGKTLGDGWSPWFSFAEPRADGRGFLQAFVGGARKTSDLCRINFAPWSETGSAPSSYPRVRAE